MEKSLGIACLAMLSVVAPLAASAQVVPGGMYEREGCELRIFYDINVSTLTQTQVSAITEFVGASQDDLIAVRGYASNIGDPESNRALSQRRANGVAVVIEASGQDVAASAFGESGEGPYFQRTDVVRDDCAAALIEAAAPEAAAPLIGGRGIAAGLGLLILLGVAGSGGSSDGT
jgi:hypothetical protein